MQVDQIIWVKQNYSDKNWRRRAFAYFNDKGECCCWYGGEYNSSQDTPYEDVRVWKHYSEEDPSTLPTVITYNPWYTGIQN